MFFVLSPREVFWLVLTFVFWCTSRLMNPSASLRRRVWPHLRLVSFFVTLTESHRSRVLLETRSWESWKLMVLSSLPSVFVLFIWIATFNETKGVHLLYREGLAPEIPEDLYHLIKKAVAIRKHLERNRKDKDSKFRLILVESRIHRLARYYKKTKKLPPVWK